MSVETKTAVSVAEMARMVGLSRARFYQLQGSAFPLPVYNLSTRRPIYVEEMQVVCLEVRRRNCGIDGKPILFYARRPPITTASKKKSSVSKISVSPDLLTGLQSLGLAATQTQVAGGSERTVSARNPGDRPRPRNAQRVRAPQAERRMSVTSFEYQMDYMTCGVLTLDEFIQRHGHHEIIECDNNALMQMPMSVKELRQMCGDGGEIEYLGEASPFYLDNDGLFFVIRPLTKKGTVSKRKQIHVVVYVV